MKQIVFDMDGVLFATEALSDRLWKEMMEERGTPEMTAALQQCRSRNRTDTRAFFASHYPDFPYIAMETEKRNRMLAVLDKDGMPTMKGAESLLQALQDAGWSVALATSTSRKTTMHHLELSGFTRYFSVIVTGDEIQHGKPNPEIYLTACKKLHSKPEETYAVEDSENGGTSACAAGMRVLLVPDQAILSESLQQRAEAVLPSLCEVQERLLGTR